RSFCLRHQVVVDDEYPRPAGECVPAVICRMGVKVAHFTGIRQQQPLFLQPNRRENFVVPKYVATRPVLLLRDLEVEPPRFVRLGVVLWRHGQLRFGRKIGKYPLCELAVLGAVQDHTRLRSAATEEEKKPEKRQTSE